MLCSNWNELGHDSLWVRQALIDAGHTPIMAPNTMYDLGMSTERITRMVQSVEADAWIVYAESSETLQWFITFSSQLVLNKSRQTIYEGEAASLALCSSSWEGHKGQWGQQRAMESVREL